MNCIEYALNNFLFYPHCHVWKISNIPILDIVYNKDDLINVHFEMINKTTEIHEVQKQ